MASEYEDYRCRCNSGKRTSVGVRSGSVRIEICRGNQLSFVKTPPAHTQAAHGQGCPPPLRKPEAPTPAGQSVSLHCRHSSVGLRLMRCRYCSWMKKPPAWTPPPRGRRCGGLPLPRAWRGPGETKRGPNRLFGAGRRWPTHHHVVIGGGIGAALGRDARPTAYSRHLSDDGAQTSTRRYTFMDMEELRGRKQKYEGKNAWTKNGKEEQCRGEKRRGPKLRGRKIAREKKLPR